MPPGNVVGLLCLTTLAFASACGGGSDSGPGTTGGTNPSPIVQPNDQARPNQPPTIGALADVTVLTDSPVEISPLIGDPDGDSLSITVSTLPPGLTFNEITGHLSGTPTSAGITDIEITATDPLGETASTSFTLTVAEEPVAGEEPVIGEEPAISTVKSSQLPVVSVDNLVSWPFAPLSSGLAVHVAPFVEMPLASNGGPARWNDLTTLGDRLFVLDEQDGRIFEITDREPRIWFDVGVALQANTGYPLNTANPWHGGLRSLAFHPDFGTNGKLYTSLMAQRPDNPSVQSYLSESSAPRADSVLVEWTADTATLVVDPASYREVFRIGVPEFDHTIKQIEFDPFKRPGDEGYGLLYVAHGDGSVESSTVNGGERNDALGKILRIDPLATDAGSYSIPADNPFVNDTGMLDEVYSLGHRNPHHLAFAEDHTLLVAEAGRDNIDEINVIDSGGNYGWSQREGSFTHLSRGSVYDGIAALPADDELNGYVYPSAQYGHTGERGQFFVRLVLGGGFVVENGSPLDGEYFYVEFATTGELFHSRLSDLKGARTRGSPDALSMAQTWLATVYFDHDDDARTEANRYASLAEIIKQANGFTGTDRLDIRIGQGPGGELYLMSKRNNMIYLVTSSMPGGPGGASDGVDIVEIPGPDQTPDPTGGNDESGRLLYESACSNCHSTEFPGAPQLGDAVEWARRPTTDPGNLDLLVASVISGKGNMPAFEVPPYSRAELLEAVGYLTAAR